MVAKPSIGKHSDRRQPSMSEGKTNDLALARRVGRPPAGTGRLPLGSRAGLRRDPRLPARGSARGRRRDRSARLERPLRRARRSLVPARVPRSAERGAGQAGLERSIEVVVDKMIERHPHVFGGAAGRERRDQAARRRGGGGGVGASQAREPERRGLAARRSRRLDAQPAGLLPDDAEGGRRRLRLGIAGRGARQGEGRDRRARGRRREPTAPRRAKRSATSCSRSPTWRAISASIPRPQPRRPTSSSAAGSATSRTGCARRDGGSIRRRSPRWTRCGKRRRRTSAPTFRQPGIGQRLPSD